MRLKDTISPMSCANRSLVQTDEENDDG